MLLKSECRIHETKVDGEQKAIILENDKIKVTILADKGSDIYEFVYKPLNLDIMWHYKKLDEVVNCGNYPISENSSFLDNYEGCWQEIFPNAGGDCFYKNAHLPQHGEICSMIWNYSIVENTQEIAKIKMWVNTKRTPFLVEKTLTIKKNECILNIEESITNKGNEEMEFTWGHHPAFGEPLLSEDCVIQTSAKKIFSSPTLFHQTQRMKANNEYCWPYIENSKNETIDLSAIPPKTAGTADMYFLKEFEGPAWYLVYNKLKEIGFRLEWDKEMFPYLWMWLICQGAKGYPFYSSTYSLALEPFTSYQHSDLNDAIANGTSKKIKPGEVITTTLRAEIVTCL